MTRKERLFWTIMFPAGIIAVWTHDFTFWWVR